MQATAFPWTVAVVTKGVPAQDGAFCGGTLIAADRVLTAAHCIDPDGIYQATAADLQVVVGQTSLCAGQPVTRPRPNRPRRVCTTTNTTMAQGQRLNVSEISIHPSANVLRDPDGNSTSIRYDAAILTLAHRSPINAPRRNRADHRSGADQRNDPDNASSPGNWATPRAWGPSTGTYVFGGASSSPRSGTGDHEVGRRRRDADNKPSMPRLADGLCAQRLGSAFQFDDMLCAGHSLAHPALRRCLQRRFGRPAPQARLE